MLTYSIPLLVISSVALLSSRALFVPLLKQSALWKLLPVGSAERRFKGGKVYLACVQSWREWVRARNFMRRAPHSSRDLRGFLLSRSGPKFARAPTPAGYAGYSLV